MTKPQRTDAPPTTPIPAPAFRIAVARLAARRQAATGRANRKP